MPDICESFVICIVDTDVTPSSIYDMFFRNALTLTDDIGTSTRR